MINTLKGILKDQKMTYSELSERLGCSESSIKYTFRKKDGSVSSLNQICEAIGVSFSDLVIKAVNEEPVVSRYSQEQENFFIEKINYFYFFDELLVSGCNLNWIRSKYKLSEASIRKYLAKLEDLQLLEVHPKDRIKLIVKPPINVFKGSELYKVLAREYSTRFLNHVFPVLGDDSKTFLRIRSGRLSEKGMDIICRGLQEQCDQFDKVGGQDELAFNHERLNDFNMLIVVSKSLNIIHEIPEI
ncbi:helix-turn-helix domain-containing protein [Pseudobacteriovorax antillogorgiicola]|uniref:helix-turn-helix domain-containing protein n=1 Tax=Pseudobacteriovorax antillogorgiicola TaxID=1513793 RepID=UPI002286AE26|nr:helix-turn-helix transcriptional regulator [Pseudobacteriovorax antillogorgiicola]